MFFKEKYLLLAKVSTFRTLSVFFEVTAMVRSNNPRGTGALSSRIRRLQAKARKITHQAWPTTPLLGLSRTHTDELNAKLGRQSKRVAHAWTAVRKLQVKHHKGRMAKIEKQVANLLNPRKGTIRSLTPKQSSRLAFLASKKAAEEGMIGLLRQSIRKDMEGREKWHQDDVDAIIASQGLLHGRGK